MFLSYKKCILMFGLLFRIEDGCKSLINGLTSKQPNLPRVRLPNTETMSEKSR